MKETFNQKNSPNNEETLKSEIKTAEDWFVAQMRERGVPDEMIEVRRNLFVGIVEVTRELAPAHTSTPLQIARAYLKKFDN